MGSHEISRPRSQLHGARTPKRIPGSYAPKDGGEEKYIGTVEVVVDVLWSWSRVNQSPGKWEIKSGVKAPAMQA